MILSTYSQVSPALSPSLAIQHTHIYLPAIKAEFLRKEGAKSGNVAKEKYLHNVSQMQTTFYIVLSTFCTFFSFNLVKIPVEKKIPSLPPD